MNTNIHQDHQNHQNHQHHQSHQTKRKTIKFKLPILLNMKLFIMYVYFSTFSNTLFTDILKVDNAVEIYVMLGVDGVNSQQELFELPSLRSPGNGVIEITNDDIIEAISSEATYMEIRTRSKPFGAIRGGLKFVDACKLVFDNQVSEYEDTFGSLDSSDTSIFSYGSEVDKDDDEFDIYVQVINSGNWLAPCLIVLFLANLFVLL